MGQYHHPVCIEAEEGLDAHRMDCGIKEGEMAFSRPSPLNAMIALVCARGGNTPADCSQSPLVGRWAGKRVLVQGDYAEDSEIPGWDGPPLSRLYAAMRPLEERTEFTAKDYPSSTPAELCKWNQEQARTPVFADVSREARDFLEGVCNVRYFERTQQVTDGDRNSPTYGQVISSWTSVHSVRVRPLARHYGNSGVAEYVLDPSYTAEDLAYLKRCGMDPKDVMRPPRSGDWHGFTPEEILEGQTRVIVNLDTLEYIDPVKFGQAPTLAGMVSLAPEDRDLPILAKAAKGWGANVVDVAGGLFVMLCHPTRRGGGDIPANAAAMGGIDKERAKYARLFKGAEDVKGRWRGSRILGTSEFVSSTQCADQDWPTTGEVIERGTDISDCVLKYLVAISHY
jgi:hypothetical protein